MFFVRHAKSSWADPYAADIDRPLNKRGLRDAPIMASHLKNRIAAIDCWLVSPAKRAQMTAEYLAHEIQHKVRYDAEAVYHAWTDTLIDQVRNIDDQFETAIVFGHNPGFTYLFNVYSRDALDNLPTCGIFELNINSEHWSDIDPSNTDTVWLIYPKLFTR